MKNKIIVYTRAYNTKPYLKQCIESVLNQTYPHFEYLLVDNGCTDGSSEILQEYAKQDNRIRLIRYEKNSLICTRDLIKQYVMGDYITILDSDDWWESNYLERMLKLAVDTNADIVSTGTLMHTQTDSETRIRKLEQQLVLKPHQYGQALSLYYAFFRTTWAKLIHMELYLNAKTLTSQKIKELGITYGADTLAAFAYLQNAKCLCLDNSLLHHYRIHKQSISYQYNPKRFFSDTYLYDNAIHFLERFGPVSEQNRQFLQIVYANALIDTLRVIGHSKLSPAEKLRECATITKHPLTIEVYQKNAHENVANSRVLLLQLILKCGLELNGQENEDFQISVHTLFPQCGGKIQTKNLSLLIKEPKLQQAFLQGDCGEIIRIILELIEHRRYSKQYNLGEFLHSFIPETSALHLITDTRFFREHAIICKWIIQNNNMLALEQMTEQLMDEKSLYSKEVFLELYLSLAASENQVPAFLFGKISLAKFYLENGDREKCHIVMKELEEMGMSDNEEFLRIRQSLIEG